MLYPLNLKFRCIFEVHCIQFLPEAKILYSAQTCFIDSTFSHISLWFYIETSVILRLKVMYMLSARTCLHYKKSPADKEFSLRNYGSMTNCMWILEGPVGNKLQLTVSLMLNY